MQTRKRCAAKKEQARKEKPKNKIPPTNKYHPNCPVRESSPWIIYVYVCLHCWFPPWMSCFGLFFLHTSTQIYFVKHFPVFPYLKLQLRTPCRPYPHICTHAKYIYIEQALSLSLSLFLWYICMLWTAAGAKQKRRLLPRLARKSILQAKMHKFWRN